MEIGILFLGTVLCCVVVFVFRDIWKQNRTLKRKQKEAAKGLFKSIENEFEYQKK